MRVSDLAEDLLDNDVPVLALRAWAQSVVADGELDNGAAMRALYAAAEDAADAYSEVSRIVAGAYMVRWGSEADRPIEVRDVVAPLMALADEHRGDPLIGRWLAEAALTVADEMAPGGAVEMHTLVWRCALAHATLPAPVVAFYVQQLVYTDQTGHGVVLDAHLAPIRLAAVERLKTMLPDGPRLLLNVVQAHAYADLAVASAAERRAQATEHYVDRIEETLAPAIEHWRHDAQTPDDQAFLTAINLWWRDAYLADPLLRAADALLAAARGCRAVRVLERAVEMGTDGDTNMKELRLLKTIFARVGALEGDGTDDR
jgi:hypothetical protein